MSQKLVPYQVETTLKQLGSNIRTARVRRNVSLKDMADRLGVHRSVLRDVENGRPGTAISAYLGMLWAMDLMQEMQTVAAPERDFHGMALASADERERASSRRGLDNDF